ncbi:MAG: hypothetical protein EXR28_13530 [Betaproteobacteria bacterium]|nr:hypothetical protein [Betaproteobacteria bacterium]
MSNTVGSPHDVTLRAASQTFSQIFGQPFDVDSRPAGRGVITTTGCIQSAPDGHTICLNSFINISLNPFLYPDGLAVAKQVPADDGGALGIEQPNAGTLDLERTRRGLGRRAHELAGIGALHVAQGVQYLAEVQGRGGAPALREQLGGARLCS